MKNLIPARGLRPCSIAWFLVLSACGGPEPQIRNLEPVIALAPEAVRFDDLGPPETATEQVFVTNSGGADLVIDEITLQGGAGGFSFDVETPLTLKPGEEYALDVTFAPLTFRDYTGRVAFASNDEEHPKLTVPLIGRGIDKPFPDIEILPGQTVVPDWPEPIVPLGQHAMISFEIWNVGDADLELGAITVADELGADAPEFVEIYGQSGNTVRPGQSTLVVYGYYPADIGGDLGIVTIPSNDPDEDPIIVQLNGNDKLELPEAVIDCPAEVLLTGPEWVHLSGAESYDPAGYVPLLYSWDVTDRPDASDAAIPLDPRDTEEVDLYVDVAGQWSIQLRVLNALGALSEPTVCTFMAIPEDDLHVELSWDTPSADLDLHLVQGGAALWDRPEDCTWCNKVPDWGTASDDDDPRLDIDDLGGYGPENINILSPEDGTYEVKVHYYDRHGDGPSVATVHVWLDGVEVHSGSQVMSEGDVWNVGVADLPAATFAPDGTIGTTPRMGCQ